jgi:hypothetical protein
MEYVTEVHNRIDRAEMIGKRRFFNAGNKRVDRGGIGVHVRKYHSAHSS